MKTYRCEFCNKPLSEEKGELAHGCLDCAGYIYKRNGTYYCEHCISDSQLLQFAVDKATTSFDEWNLSRYKAMKNKLTLAERNDLRSYLDMEAE